MPKKKNPTGKVSIDLGPESYEGLKELAFLKRMKPTALGRAILQACVVMLKNGTLEIEVTPKIRKNAKNGTQNTES
jgi:hypothetical protein